MTAAKEVFGDDQLEAARRFAHTLIVVDDEAENGPAPTEVVAVQVPGRIQAIQAGDSDRKTRPSRKVPRRVLNAAALIEKSMELGLVCSVLKPRQGSNPAAIIANASSKADIICVDWEIYDDDGKIAVDAIKAIIEEDEKSGGRMRLIAVYTAIRDRDKIYDTIIKRIPNATIRRRSIVRAGNYIESSDGLRIVWLFKDGIKDDTAAGFQISEDALPERLQLEFSLLSKGLLSNVAIATIASIRNATHHVIGKFARGMDAPYFHHRATLETPDDAEEYASRLVLSELKSAIDRNGLADRFAGAGALGRAIDGRFPGGVVSYEVGTVAAPKEEKISVSDLTSIIVDGLGPTFKRLEEEKKPLPVTKRQLRTMLTVPFDSNAKDNITSLLEFAAMTEITADAGTKYVHYLPALSLGSVLRDADGHYLLCVQASCDAVRLRVPQAFLFIQLTEVPEADIWKEAADGKIEFVVPVRRGARRSRTLACLQIATKAPYTALRSVEFSPTDAGVVHAQKNEHGEWEFKARQVPAGKRAEKHKRFLWVADLKRRRALRTVHHIGQMMGRIGFDEFEPFRRKLGSD